VTIAVPASVTSSLAGQVITVKTENA